MRKRIEQLLSTCFVRSLPAAWLVAIGMWAFPTATNAQASCPGVRIRDDSSVTLDEDAICTAATPWTERGNQVYVFVTDDDASSEDDWFAIRDEVETGWGIYNTSTQQFAINALAIEVMTETSYPWGQDIAFGESLFDTPLDDDATVARLEGRLKNQVSDGDVSAALVDALTIGYETAFPAQAVAPTSAGEPSTPTETSGLTFAPTAIVSDDAAGGADDDASRDNGFLGAVGALAAGVVALVVALAATPTVIMPALRRRRERKRLLAHLDDVSDTVGSLLYAARTLFTGQSPEETTLWRLFLVYGGDQYAELAATVRDWTEQSMKALGEVLVVHEDMDHRTPGKEDEDVKALIRSYEIMYLTLVGTNPTILQMNEDEFKNFIDPMAGGIEPPTAESGLVTQIRDLRRQLGEQPLRITLEVVDPNELDADGVFGYANRIKGAIQQLVDAQEHAPAALSAIRESRASAAASITLPSSLDPAIAFGGVDALLHSADEEQRGERWLLVQAHAEAATALLERLTNVLPIVSDALNQYGEREREVQNSVETGYRIPGLGAARQEADTLMQKLYRHLRSGEIDQIQPALDLIAARSEATHAGVTARVELRDKNVADLKRLAAEVARVEQMRTTEAEPALRTLQAYSAPNWNDLAQNVTSAAATLRRLFDTPGDPNDLASTIERQNSMDQQDFDAAEQALVDAFAALHTAEQHVNAVIARLTEVQKIEREASAIVQETNAALDAALARRDRDDSKIDASVDQHIAEATQALEQAKAALDERSYIVASAAFNRTRSLAAAAQASADEQARTIDALYTELTQTQEHAHANVAATATELEALPPSAQTAPTVAAVADAQNAYRTAEATAATLAGKEDRILADALRTTIATFQQVAAQAEQARQGIRADQQTYERAISDAQKAIGLAQAAIDSANAYVIQPDAGRSGGDALRQGRELLPTIPPYGTPVDAFVRIMAQALRAQNVAKAAGNAARIRIMEIEAQRAAERQRQQEAERRRRTEEAERQRREDASRRATERSHSSSSWSSSSRRSSSSSRSSSSRRSSSSSRSSSFSSSSRSSRSSSMGSSRRR